MNNIELKQIMANVFEVDIEIIDDTFSQKNIDSWDSLRHLNFIVEIEDKYGISLEPDEISEMVSIQKVIEILKKYVDV